MDLHMAEKANAPLVIFVHGFKGFKDWGHWPLMGDEFAKNGFNFLRFNFSHNGTTVDRPTEFADLEAFSNNDLIKELNDLKTVVDGVAAGSIFPEVEIDRRKIMLIGHSRGGGIAMIAAAELPQVKAVSVFASVNHYDRGGFPLDVWESQGQILIPNARTGQDMPMKWRFVQVLKANLDRLNILAAASRLTIPGLVVHGTADPTVPYKEAIELSDQNDRLELLTLENGDHVFGGSHPFSSDKLPTHTDLAVTATINRFNAAL